MSEGDRHAMDLDQAQPEQLEQFLRAQLECSGLTEEEAQLHFGEACAWYAELLGEGQEHLPFFLVLDVGVLLHKGSATRLDSDFLERGDRLFLHDSESSSRYSPYLWSSASELDPTGVPGTQFEQGLRLKLSYQSQILGRVLRIGVLDSIAEALQRLPQDAQATAWLLTVLFGSWRTGAVTPSSLTPSFVRQVGANPVWSGLRVADRRTGQDSLSEAESRHRAEQQRAFLRGAWRSLAQCLELNTTHELGRLGAEDVFVLEHFELLGRGGQRLLVRERADLERSFGEPGWVERPREYEEVVVPIEAVGYFPQGGLDGLSNRGGIENLLRSELVYIDESEHPDLFSVRYQEGELLYYLRDEGQLVRRRRRLMLILDVDECLELKLPTQPARLSSYVVALAQRLILDVFELFSSDALQLSVRLLGSRAEELQRWFALRFADALRRGELQLWLGWEQSVWQATSAVYLGWRGPRQVVQAECKGASQEGCSSGAWPTPWVVLWTGGERPADAESGPPLAVLNASSSELLVLLSEQRRAVLRRWLAT